MISLIISFYKNIPALRLIFEALQMQTFTNFEAIVAEDDNAAATTAFLEQCRMQYRFPILHASHADCGFRKCKILNDAIRLARGKKLVFIDGDCIPHRRFLEVYDKHICMPNPESRIQNPESRIQNPESRIQNIHSSMGGGYI